MARSKEMEIAIKIAGKVESSFKNALGQATKGLGGITKAVGAATAAAAAAVGGIGIAAINTGREFEGAMSQVAATMLIDKTSEEGQKAFETLENAARDCGASTAFSATEAAEALNYLALAGYDADKAATALPTVLKLAGAGAMELAAASDMMTDSMSALGIKATEENLTSFADKMAQTASKSNTSVAQLGEAILTVGGTAQGLAGGTTELNAALGILADNGIKAAEGGTHLRNMILSLQSPRNDAAAALFEDMGLKAYDAEGNMRSLGNVFGDLNRAMAGASAEEVNNTLSTIFKLTDLASARAMLSATADSVQSLGTVMDASLAESGTSLAALGINLQEMADNFDIMTTQEEFSAEMLEQFGMAGEQSAALYSGLQSVLKGTGNRFEELSAVIEDSAGACENMYAIQLDNLNGDIDILKSGLSDLGISIYKDLNGPLRKMTQLATDMVGELSKAYKEGGMSGMISTVGDCLSEVVGVIAEYAPKVINLGVELLKNFIGGITDNSKALADSAAEVISIFVEGLFTLVPQVIFAGIDIITQFAQSITRQLPQIISSGTQAVTNFIKGIMKRLPSIVTTAITLVQTFVNSILNNAPELLNAAVQLINSLSMGIVSMLPCVAEMALQIVVSLIKGIVKNIPQIIHTITQMIEILINSIVKMLPDIIQMGAELILSLIQGIVKMLPDIIQMGVELVLSLVHGIMGTLPDIVSAGIQLIQNLVQSILEMLPEMIQAGINLVINLMQGIISELPEIFSSGVKIIKSFIQGIAQMLPEVLNTAIQTVTALIQGIVQMLPNLIQTGVELIVSFIQSIAGMLPEIVQAGINMISGLIQGLIQMLPNVLQCGIQLIFAWLQGLITGLPNIIAGGMKIIASLLEGLIKSIPSLIAFVLHIPLAIIDAIFSTDWLQVGKDILSGIKDGFISAFTGLIDSVKGLWTDFKNWIFGDDESYAAGIESSTTAAATAASNLSSVAFSTLDHTSAANAGTTGAQTYTTALANGLSGFTLDTSFNNSTFTQNLSNAGTESGTAFMTSLDNSMSAYTFDSSKIMIDTTGIEKNFTTAGMAGTAALGNEISNGAIIVTTTAAAMANDINGALDNGWNTVQSNANNAMSNLVNIIQSKAQEATLAIKSAFENLSIVIPKPKIPVITTTYKTESYGDNGNVSLPQFQVNWNAKGGIFDKPTLFNTSAGLQGIGEAGPEAILPLDTLWTKMKDILNETISSGGRSSIVDMLLEKLKGIGTGADQESMPKIEAANGPNITYAPVYNLLGSSTKQDVVEAEKLSQSEFNKMLKQFFKDEGRVKF